MALVTKYVFGLVLLCEHTGRGVPSIDCISIDSNVTINFNNVAMMHLNVWVQVLKRHVRSGVSISLSSSTPSFWFADLIGALVSAFAMFLAVLSIVLAQVRISSLCAQPSERIYTDHHGSALTIRDLLIWDVAATQNTSFIQPAISRVLVLIF